MARPNKEGMTYFPHDVQARNDMKIRKLRAVHGNDGYATFFILLEMIYENKHYELDVSDAETRLILAEECRISSEKLDLIILKCTELGLFDKNIYTKRMILTGESIKKRTEPVENKRKRNKTYYEETKQNSQPEDKSQVSDAEMKVSEAETSTESTQSKDKDKDKDKDKENKKDIIVLTSDEESFINVLKSVENYPLDLVKDREMFNTLKNKYAALDMLEAIKTWAIYKIDKPLEKKSNPRSQINTSFNNYVKWGKCLKGDEKKNGGYKDDIKPNYGYYDNPPQYDVDFTDLI